MKIACIGPFGDANFGDYAMLVNDIYRIGKHDYKIFTYDEGLLNNLTSTYFKNYHIECCTVKTKYDYEPDFNGTYNVEYDDIAYTPIEIINMIDDVENIKSELKNVDKLVIIGGGYFNRVWNAKHRKSKLISIMGVIVIANQLKKDICFLGNTYGPFDQSTEFFSNFFNALTNASYATRDDLYSIANLKKIGHHKNIVLLPDDLYFVEEEALQITSETVYELSENYLVLEIYSSIDEIKNKISFIRDFILGLKATYGMDVVLYPLDRKYGGEYQCNLMKDEIPEVYYLDFADNEFRKIGDVNEVIKRAKFVMCHRYHMFVLSIANNIPAMHILKNVCGDNRYYYSKSSGLLRQVFHSQCIDERFFIASNMEEGFDILRKDMNIIIDYQKCLFNDIKEQDEKNMLLARNEYIKREFIDSV